MAIDELGVTLQNLTNILDFGMNVQTSLSTVNFLGPYWDEPPKQAIRKGTFSKDLLKEVRGLGQDIKLLSGDEAFEFEAAWIGVTIDPMTGRMQGAVPEKNIRYEYGHAEGY